MPRMVDPGEGQLPPHDEQAELALLYSLGADGSELARTDVRPDDFYLGAHRAVFSAMRALDAEGERVSGHTLHTKLKEHGQLARVPAEVLEKVDYFPGAGVAVSRYARIVREYAKRRRVIEAARRAMMQCYLPHDTSEDVIGELRETFERLTEVREERPRFRVWTAAEIWEPLPAAEYAIGGLLMKGNLALLCAYGSSFKSWLEIDLLVSKASGGRWLEMFPCDAGPALLVDWESDDWEDRRRFQAVARARGLVGPVDGVHMLSLPTLYFTSPDFEATVRELAKTYKLICFDTLSAGSPGVEENDTRFAAGLNILKRVGPELGCTFVVLHHSRKGKAEGGGDEREAVRGTGAIFAAADVVLQMSKREDGSFLVRQTKARGGKSVDPFVVRVTDVPAGGVRVHGEPVAEDDEAEDMGTANALATAKRRVLAALASEHGLTSKSAIFRRTGGAKKAAFDAIDDLMENGIVVIHETAYRLRSEVDK